MDGGIGISKLDLKEGIDAVFDESASPFIKACVVAEVEDGLPNVSMRSGLSVLDPSIGRSGGAAFLWEDVLAVGDAAEAIGELLEDLSPERAAQLILKIVLAWRRMRLERVMLTKEEFRVINAIKRGSSSEEEVAKTIKAPLDQVEAIVRHLTSRRYKREMPLVESKDGRLVTRF